MKTKLFLLILLIFFCQTLYAQRGVGNQTVTKLPAKEKRWALIIGVDNYGLKGAVNDAKALKNALVKYAGFPENQVVLLTTDDSKNQPDRRNILIELDKLSRSVPADGLFLFSFSGHGKTVGDNAFLIPSDGQMTNNNKLLRDISIDVKSIKEAIEEMRVKQVLMLIDACRDRIEGRGNESEPLTKAVTNGFSFDEANKTIEAFVTLYATRLGESAYEYFDKETNQYRGYFSRALEEGLSGKAANAKGEVTLAALIKYIEDTVPARSYRNESKKQIPWKNTNNGYKENELILAIVNKNQTVSGSTSNSSNSAKLNEENVWRKIENSNRIDDFEDYLARCGKGEFTCIYKSAAESKLKRLKSTNNQTDPVSWSKMPLVKGKIIPKPSTVIFGEKYSDAIYLPEEIAGFRTEKKYKKLIMQVGVQDNSEATGSKHFWIKDENGILYESDARVNRRPVEVEIDISNSDVIGLMNSDSNGQTHEFVRYLNIVFVPKSDAEITVNEIVKNNETGFSWSKMPLVKGKVIPKSNTTVFGEKFADSIYLPEETVTFRTAKKYKKLILKVGIQDNAEATGSKRFWIKDENGNLYEGQALVNRRPITIEIDISNSDVVGFTNYDTNGQTHEFFRYLNVVFIPK